MFHGRELGDWTHPERVLIREICRFRAIRSHQGIREGRDSRRLLRQDQDRIGNRPLSGQIRGPVDQLPIDPEGG